MSIHRESNVEDIQITLTTAGPGVAGHPNCYSETYLMPSNKELKRVKQKLLL